MDCETDNVICIILPSATEQLTFCACRGFNSHVEQVFVRPTDNCAGETYTQNSIVLTQKKSCVGQRLKYKNNYVVKFSAVRQTALANGLKSRHENCESYNNLTFRDS